METGRVRTTEKFFTKFFKSLKYFSLKSVFDPEKHVNETFFQWIICLLRNFRVKTHFYSVADLWTSYSGSCGYLDKEYHAFPAEVRVLPNLNIKLLIICPKYPFFSNKNLTYCFFNKVLNSTKKVLKRTKK